MPPQPSPQNILIFGATGTIGAYITSAIVSAQPPFQRVAIYTTASTVSKKAAQIAALKEKSVEIFVGDVADESAILDAFKGIDTIVSALGRPALPLQTRLLTLAADCPGVTRFYPSEFGTDVAFDASSAAEPTHQAKLAVRAHLEGLEAVRTGKLEYAYLVTGPYAEMAMGREVEGAEGAGGFEVEGRRARVVGDGEGRVAYTTMRDVGTLLVAALRHPHVSRNRALKVNSFTTTPHQILAEFVRQTGTRDADWKVEYTSMTDLERLEKEAWEAGNPAAGLFTLRRIWAQGKTLYERRDNGVLGEPEMETLEAVVGRVIEAQTRPETAVLHRHQL
ncbi:NAD(P)-binding protein [Saccharata proteae CBS 121410]|uniref:NAD(P)-binding protein n=1 Tax=Saccharata proteae CBS 121410 TaxID=1314787 RepID=A0A9P4HVA2_9PEZI|nr:NAD(P)-binding protein [Saccharata proteae CBS 121410]